MKTKISDQQFKRAIHPNESSRFLIALLFCVPAIIIALILTFTSFGLILLFVGFIVLMFWFTLNILEAHLTGNAIRVSKLNFPEVYSAYNEVKEAIGYTKEIPIFIVQDGDINALIGKFFNKKFIILNSGLVEGITKYEEYIQLKWIIGRFIGAIKAKHYRADILKIIIESVEKMIFFNIFILPYERATQYTGDNIGLLICEDVEQVFIAFDKFMVGNTLAKSVNFQGVLNQGADIHDSFFAVLARLFSPHPHLVSRYLNLLAFARSEFPDQFHAYISKFDKQTTLDIELLLPRSYKRSASPEIFTVPPSMAS